MVLGFWNYFVKTIKSEYWGWMRGFNLGENLAYVLIAYPNTNHSLLLLLLSDFFHLSFCSVLCLSLAQLYAHELEWRNSLLFSMTLHAKCTWLSDPAFQMYLVIWIVFSMPFLLYCIWLTVSKSTGSLRYSDKLISSLCFLGIPLIHLLKNIHFLSYQAYLAITTK